MFLTIFKFELKYWLKQPMVYVFMFIFMLLGMGIMAGYAGAFDPAAEPDGLLKLANSPLNIHSIHTIFKELLLILLPIIIGQSIYRDFVSNIHTVFYSYPFRKPSFLFAKFFSALCIVVLISLGIGLGAFFGTLLPGVNNQLLAPFSFTPYLLEYCIFIVPNALFYGMLVFSIVALSRNIYSGFIAVIALVAFQQIIGRIFLSMDNLTLFALFDPFGDTAVKFYMHQWTIIEQNTNLIPLNGLVIYNRLLWLFCTVIIFAGGYKLFSFTKSVGTIRTFRKKTVKLARRNFGSITKIELPEVHFDYSVFAEINACWRLSQVDFKYIIKSGPFLVILVIGFSSVLFTLSQMNPQYATKLLPVTWLMLLFPVFFFLMVVNLLTFLYAGKLIHRAQSTNMNQLLDASPVSTWVLVVSKFLALIKMQIVLLSLVAIAGILVQTFSGYFHYEFDLYLFHLFVLNLIGCVIWACLALLVQSVFTNPYLGLFLLIVGAVGIGELQLLGIENTLLRYNQNPDADFLLSYSDMGGYGAGLTPFLLYKFYWLLGGLILLFGAWMFYVRGVVSSFKERIVLAKARLNKYSISILGLLIFTFISSGFTIQYFENMGTDDNQDTIGGEPIDTEYLKQLPQPRITDVSINLNIYPEARDFKALGEYILVNKSASKIDTLVISLNEEVQSSFALNREYMAVNSHTNKHLKVIRLVEPLLPKDSLTFTFDVSNYSNTWFKKNSPIETNGTFLTSHMFVPKIGIEPERFEIVNLSDSSALQRMYRSSDADFINFEATISTSKDQIAIAPGYLEKEWLENDRKYYHFKSDSKVTNDYVFNSGKYNLAKDTWVDQSTGKEVDLTIYHHPSHTYNLDKIMNGLKAGLEYNSKYFAPYQHKQARITEYSRSLGNYGQSYANTLPLSEVNFVADIDTREPGSLDKLFGGIAHEIAHQWWGHQAIPAGAAGYAMITESMSEYVALRVIEKEYGSEMLKTYTKLSMEKYLKERARSAGKENPLIQNSGQEEAHVPYEKGSLAMYALSEYLGEDRFNNIIKDYLKEVRFKEAPYTTAGQMAAFIKRNTPDSLKYLVHDLFETVTLYDNKVSSVKTKEIEPDKYKVEIEFDITKFRSGAGGERIYYDNESYEDDSAISLPLKDYIELVIFVDNNKDKEVIFHKNLLIDDVNNKLTVVLDKKPVEVAIDPYHKLIDTNLKDNFMQIE